jgi:hypothetical protein
LAKSALKDNGVEESEIDDMREWFMPNKAGRGRGFFSRTLSRATVISERKIKKKVNKKMKK